MTSPSPPSSSLASRPSPSSIASELPALVGAGGRSPSSCASVERSDDSAACVCGRAPPAPPTPTLVVCSSGGERRRPSAACCPCPCGCAETDVPEVDAADAERDDSVPDAAPGDAAFEGADEVEGGARCRMGARMGGGECDWGARACDGGGGGGGACVGGKACGEGGREWCGKACAR